MLFGHTKITVSRATLHRVARHPVAAAFSCRTVVIFGRVEQRASVLGKCYYGFLSSPPPCSSFTSLLFSTSGVSHVCAFRVHGYLECTPCPEALPTTVCRDIFVYAGKLNNSMRYALWSLCFLSTLRIVIFYLWLWNFAFQQFHYTKDSSKVDIEIHKFKTFIKFWSFIK